MLGTVEREKELDAEAARERSPEQKAAFRLAAVLLVANVFLVLIVSLILKLEKVSLVSIILTLAVARYLYKLRPGVELIALGLAGLATVAAPILYFWSHPLPEAVFETLAVWGMAGPLFLLLIGQASRGRRIAAVTMFIVFRVAIYALAVIAGSG